MKRNKLLGAYCKYFFLILGSVLISISILLLYKFTMIYDFVVNSALEIKPNTEAYNAWKTNDPPLILDIYFFNWTNAEDVYNSDIKPNFVQVGPYRFLEVKEKYNITFHPNNNTVSFEYLKKYFFMEDESPKKLTDVINTINPISLTAAYKARHWSYFRKKILSFTLSTTSNIYIKKTIDELLFTGFEDPLLSTARTVSTFMPGDDPILDRFGWFYKRNNTKGLSGDFSMYYANDENFGKISSWNYKNRTTFFEGVCGDIHGSAGEFHPINRQRGAPIEIYSSEMCTFAPLDYEKDTIIKGVQAYKYSANTLFDNGTKVPENACYCNGECIPSGVLNISSCRMNSPIFLSLPHFYNADPYYTQIIDGLNPNKEEHDFYVTLEPKSAIVVDIGARMQLNMLLQPLAGISLYTNVPKIFVPVFFFDQVVIMTDELAPKIRLLQDFPEISEMAAYTLIITGSLLIIGTILLHFIFCYKNSETKADYKITPNKHRIEEIPLRIKNDN